jgi:hypothetical protein
MCEQAVKHIQSMLELEERNIEHYSKEVTADFPGVRAELRAECLRDVLKAITKQAGPIQ